MIKDEVEMVERTSPKIVTEHIEQLKAIFPEVFSEGKVDFEKLKAALGDIVDSQPEKYSFTWAGKRNATQLLQTPSYATLTPSKEESINFDSTQNLFLEGDNLEVLKLLHKSYSGQVKVIYIDPPYNTGNDFVYPDDFVNPLDAYLKITGQKDAEGNLLTSNPETSGRYHSAWLSMMYPRLYLARQLLHDDGIIFISIDDHEVNNLRQVMNEIFGEENFLAMFVWKRRTGSNDSINFTSTDHEYIVAYTKVQGTSLQGILKDFSNYSNPDNDPRGPWAPDNLTCNKTAEERPNLYYPITNPKTGITYQCNPNRVWAYEPKRMERLIGEGKVIFPSSPSGKPGYKRHKSEVRSEKKPVSTWIESTTRNQSDLASEQFEDEVSILQVPLNAQATKEVRALLQSQVFNYPKPVQLVSEFIKQATTGKDDIVLDLFAGSCTTAQAVLELNQEDGGRRRFIMVQLPEPTGSKDYPTIAEVGKERIRRVIEKMSPEKEKSTLFPVEKSGDLGFRVFKLAPSNYKKWQGNPGDNAEVYANQLALFTDPLIENWKPENVLWEVAIKEGYGLNTSSQRLDEIQGNSVWKMTDPDKDQSILICLDDKLETSTLAALPLTRDHVFVCLNKALNDTIAANLALQCRLKKI